MPTPREETFQANPFGVHIATAAQLGSFDEERGFLNFPWLPDMNQPVFLAASDGDVEQLLADGNFFIEMSLQHRLACPPRLTIWSNIILRFWG